MNMIAVPIATRIAEVQIKLNLIFIYTFIINIGEIIVRFCSLQVFNHKNLRYLRSIIAGE